MNVKIAPNETSAPGWLLGYYPAVAAMPFECQFSILLDKQFLQTIGWLRWILNTLTGRGLPLPVGLLLTLANWCFATHCYSATEELRELWHQVLDRFQTNVLLSKTDWKFELEAILPAKWKGAVSSNYRNAWNWHLHAEICMLCYSALTTTVPLCWVCRDCAIAQGLLCGKTMAILCPTSTSSFPTQMESR